MGKKIGFVVLTWFLVSFCYIIIAAAMPAMVTITTGAATSLSATSNMSNYPGTLQVVQAAPVYLWFIPGGVGLIATVVFLKTNITERI